LERFLGGAPDQNFDHFALVFSGTAIVVRGIAFRGGNFTHLLQSGIVNGFSAQAFFGSLGAHDGRRDGVKT
jgi:hypothetical protein